MDATIFFLADVLLILLLLTLIVIFVAVLVKISRSLLDELKGRNQ